MLFIKRAWRRPTQALKDESGAVTIDWVVLCATVLIVAVWSVQTLEDRVDDVNTDVGTQMSAVGTIVKSRQLIVNN